MLQLILPQCTRNKIRIIQQRLILWDIPSKHGVQPCIEFIIRRITTVFGIFLDGTNLFGVECCNPLLRFLSENRNNSAIAQRCESSCLNYTTICIRSQPYILQILTLHRLRLSIIQPHRLMLFLRTLRHFPCFLAPHILPLSAVFIDRAASTVIVPPEYIVRLSGILCVSEKMCRNRFRIALELLTSVSVWSII